MDIEQARFNMIEQQIRTWNVLDLDVLEAMSAVKREAYVPAAYKNLAFFDTEVPLGNGEHMLAPKVEARILQEAAVTKDASVLEIGAGSGYFAALLAHQAQSVLTVEIDPALAAQAEKNLRSNGVANAQVAQGNGANGWGQEQYDVIVISGALTALPQAFLQQLRVGGRVLAIIGTAPVMSLAVTTRTGEQSFETRKAFELLAKPLREAAATSTFTF